MSVIADSLHGLSLDYSVRNNLLDGYRLIDQYHEQRLDLFALGNSHKIIELNHIVLYGKNYNAQRDSFGTPIELSEKHFYEHSQGGIAGFISYYERLDNKDPYHHAAGMFVYLLTSPQLFAEGNHRTGMLLMNYVLMNNEIPPVVLSAENCDEFFSLSSEIARNHKRGFMMWLGYPGQRNFYADWLLKNSNRSFLLVKT